MSRNLALNLLVFLLMSLCLAQQTQQTRYVVISCTPPNTHPKGIDPWEPFITSFRDVIDSTLKITCPRWRPAEPGLGDRIAKAFRMQLSDDEAPVDSLPYSAWELCRQTNIDTLVVFYLFDTENLQVNSIVKSIAQFAIPAAGHGTMKEELSDWNINYYMSVYDVRPNKALYQYSEDIDDLLEGASLDTERAAAEAFMKVALRRLSKKKLLSE